tara:strand:- start:1069 stop:2160 length:1092 start_codon:yes stop_codon:yes gene_type:complete
MSDLLKEAIADAKAVRETALQNAKAALEEAFTPQLKSMLSAKLQEDDVDGDGIDDETGEELPSDEVPVDDIPVDDIPVDDVPAVDGEVPVDDELPVDDLDGDGVPDETDVEEGFVIPAAASGLGYMVGGPLGGIIGAGTGGMLDDPEGDGVWEGKQSNLDLDSVIKELEEEIDAEEKPVVREAQRQPQPQAQPQAQAPIQQEQEVEEEYELDESEIDEDGTEDLTAEEVEALYHIANNSVNELAEYKEAVHFLKDKLHEVNILNAKLLYTNKLFKEYSLDNNQKLKIVENFDRAQTTREIKLVFSTVAEQLNENNGIPKRKSLKEVASAPIASTKPSKKSQKVITEENVVANRFRKLAGLIRD